MIMALITRLSRLFRADFNAVLDRIEEPDVLLKQALREMEEDLTRDKQQVKLLQDDCIQLETKLEQLEKDINETNKELDICFESGETSLARSQVKKKLELQRYQKHCQSKLDSTQKRVSDLNKRIDENTARFNAMQQKLDLLATEDNTVKKDEFVTNINLSVNEDDIDMAFLREKQARGVS
jgi:phage shock protein A